MRKFLRGRGALLVVVALLVSIVIGLCSRAFGIDPLGSVLHTLATPVRGGIHAVVTWAEGVYNYMFNYQAMADELTELRRSVARMEDELRQGREASRENEQLRQLLDLRQKRRDFVFESARVTARGAQGWDSTLTISKGSASGVALNDCVITETGALVGIVSQLGTNWATVDTVLSPNVEMGGQVTRANAAGILSGQVGLMQEGLLKLSYLPLDSGLVAGDEVLTSGRGEVFPSGLLVGTVEKVSADESGMASVALVRPTVRLDKLVEVFVIKEFEIID